MVHFTTFVVLAILTLASCNRNASSAADDSDNSVIAPIETDGQLNTAPDEVITASFSLTSTVFAGAPNTATIQIVLVNEDDTPQSGITPNISVTGFDFTATPTCSPSDISGISLCPLTINTNVPQSFKVELTDPPLDLSENLQVSLPEVGYGARPCGFDIDGDGIFGEPEDCHVCDGVTTDPDDDGELEDIFYVDAGAGNDTTGSGSSSAPFQTIQKAMDEAFASGGAEDIICIAGTFTEEVVIKGGGGAEFYLRDGLQIPSEPLLISGWDKDGDGEYPPYDTDDIALMNGAKTNNIAFDNSSNGGTHIEIAHLSVTDYDDDLNSNEGLFFKSESDAANLTHVYIHDIDAMRLAEDGNEEWSRGFMNLKTTTGLLANISVENIKVMDSSGYLFNVRATDNEFSGNMTFYNISTSFKSTNTSNPSTFILGGITGARLERIYHNSNQAVWTTPWTSFVRLYGSTQDVVIRFNRIQDGGKVLDIWTGEQPSVLRQTTGITFEHNFAHTMASSAAAAIYLYTDDPSVGPNGSIGDVLVRNNFFYTDSDTAFRAVLVSVGNTVSAETGSLLLIGNTFVGDYSSDGIFVESRSTNNFQNFTFVNNIFDVGSAGSIFNFDYAPLDPNTIDFDYNTVNSNSPSFRWTAGAINFATFQTNSSTNANSQACAPSYLNVGLNDYGLDSADTCAKAKGRDISGAAYINTLNDFEGDLRSLSAFDIGADSISP